MNATTNLPPGLCRLIQPNRAYGQTAIAQLLGVSPKSVMRWRVKGLPSPDGHRVRLDGYWAGAWRFTGRDVLDFLAAIAPTDDVPDVRAQVASARRDGADDLLDAIGL